VDVSCDVSGTAKAAVPYKL